MSTFVAWLTSKSVAKRSACKHAFGEILDALDDIEDAALTLLMQSGSDGESQVLFRKIWALNTRVGRRITELFSTQFSANRLAGRDPVPARVTEALVAMRQVVVADELLSADRRPSVATDPAFQTLNDLVSALRRELRAEAEDMGAGDLQT